MRLKAAALSVATTAILVSGAQLPNAASNAQASNQASEEPTTTAQRADTPGWVRGTVVDQNGTPIEGALVNVLDPEAVPESGLVEEQTERRAWTDEAGRFEVRQADPGYLVQICQPEADAEFRTSCKETVRGVNFVITYVGGTGVTDSWVTQRKLLPATTSDRVLGQIAVKPESRITGTVANGAQTPVRLMRMNDSVAFTVWADKNGRYEFDGIVPGPYYLSAGGQGTLSWRSRPFIAVADQVTRRDAVLREGASLAGRVLSNGAPVPGVDLVVRRNGNLFAGVTTNERGRYEVTGLTRARYSVDLVDGGRYVSEGRRVSVRGSNDRTQLDVPVLEGATIGFRVAGERNPAAVRDELRDAEGRPVQSHRIDATGRVVYTGLRPGRYTVAVGGARRFATRTVRLQGRRPVELGRIRPDRKYLTLTGTTTPHAVVEATTGDFCPPDGDPRYGAVHEIEQADASGRYRIGRLMSGRYMVGADAWPHDFAPSCRSDVKINDNRAIDLHLGKGASVDGRLVYSGTAEPVITTLSYELFFPAGSTHNPTGEHPARARTRAATGELAITGMRAGDARGAVAVDAGEDINDPSFQVVFPYQDGTPYWLSAEPRTVQLSPGVRTHLGDIAVTQH